VFQLLQLAILITAVVQLERVAQPGVVPKLDEDRHLFTVVVVIATYSL
jgi:hypothetical protein